MKKRIQHFYNAFIMALSFFFISYFAVYQWLAGGDVFWATIFNIVLIVIVVIENRLEISLLLWLRRKTRKREWSRRFINWLLIDAPMKSGLYLLYIVLLIGIALLAANPTLPWLSDFQNYFASIRYGILILVAADKFSEQVFKI